MNIFRRLKNIGPGLIILGLLPLFLISPSSALSSGDEVIKSSQKMTTQDNAAILSQKLREIYKEVRPASLVSPEGLREWQSFLGQDEDDSYKDDHLFILILEKEEETILWIQVTKFETQADRSRIKKAKGSKLIKAVLRKNETIIEKNDFGAEETGLILSEILRSIENKKKLLGIKAF
jgi:hypothetical protein